MPIKIKKKKISQVQMMSLKIRKFGSWGMKRWWWLHLNVVMRLEFKLCSGDRKINETQDIGFFIPR